MSFNKSLGSPLEYDELSEFFDCHNIGDDTNQKNAVIGHLLQQFKVSNIADFSCGTGSQVFYLHDLGFKIIGLDISKKLISLAQEKAQKKKLNLQFLHGDMRSSKIGKFDAIISIFNAIGHLTQDDFALALNNISDNLQDGGIFIFDIFNLEALSKISMPQMAMDIKKEVNGVKIHNIQTSKLDEKKSILTSFDQYKITEDSKVKNIKNSFSLQIYSFAKIKKILENSGFKIVKISGNLGEEFIDKKTQNMLIVAQKDTRP